MVTQDIRTKSDMKRGMISKTYKLNRELVEKFKDTCYRLGTSQSTEISKFMKEFIEKNN